MYRIQVLSNMEWGTVKEFEVPVYDLDNEETLLELLNNAIEAYQDYITKERISIYADAGYKGGSRFVCNLR